MYNVFFVSGNSSIRNDLFGKSYDLTPDITQANVLISYGGDITGEMLESKLIFAVADLSADGLDSGIVQTCSDHGICVFRSCGDTDDAKSRTADCVRDFIENGNIRGSVNFPDVDLGPFGDDVSRISVLMKGIDAPVLLGAMMTSEMNIRAVAGGLTGEYGAALISGREPVTRLPHVDGVLKVRVLQDI